MTDLLLRKDMERTININLFISMDIKCMRILGGSTHTFVNMRSFIHHSRHTCIRWHNALSVQSAVTDRVRLPRHSLLLCSIQATRIVARRLGWKGVFLVEPGNKSSC